MCVCVSFYICTYLSFVHTSHDIIIHKGWYLRGEDGVIQAKVAVTVHEVSMAWGHPTTCRQRISPEF